MNLCIVRWFDTNPAGRILTRLSRDMETVDQVLSTSLLVSTKATLTMVPRALILLV